MIKPTISFLTSVLCILFSAQTFSQQLFDAAAAETRLRNDVLLLASDSLQGREAGTFGEQMASSYISRSMHEIGLLPKGDTENSYLSEFRMSYPVVFKNAKLKVDDIDFKLGITQTFEDIE